WLPAWACRAPRAARQKGACGGGRRAGSGGRPHAGRGPVPRHRGTARPGRPPAARGRPGSGTGRTRIARRTSSPPRVSRWGPGGRGSAPGAGPPRPPLPPPRSGLLRPRGQSGDLAVRALVAVHQPDLAVELGALIRAGERQRLGEKVPLTWNFVVDRRALLQ